MTKIPCENCVVLAVCRAKVLSKYPRYQIAVMATNKCHLLKDYLKDEEDNYVYLDYDKILKIIRFMEKCSG
jgi:Holliday junction resolvase